MLRKIERKNPYGYPDYATIKYNASGVQRWASRYNGPGNVVDVPYSIALDYFGNVYVILGNEVAELVNEVKDAGSYKVQFDGSNLSSGMYTYRLQAGEFISSKKITLIK